MHISLAPVSADDFESLLDLRMAAMRPSLERLGIFHVDTARARFHSQFDPQSMHHLCVDEGNAQGAQGCPKGPQRVGLLTVIACRDGRTKLQHLYVRPAYQNRKIGDWAVRQVQSQERRDGKTARLEVLNHSDAIRFYERHGFVRTSGDPVDLVYQWEPV